MTAGVRYYLRNKINGKTDTELKKMGCSDDLLYKVHEMVNHMGNRREVNSGIAKRLGISKHSITDMINDYNTAHR